MRISSVEFCLGYGNNILLQRSYLRSLGQFTRCIFVPCNLLTTRLQLEKSCRILKHVKFKTLRQSWPKMCRKCVVRRLYATKWYRVHWPLDYGEYNLLNVI